MINPNHIDLDRPTPGVNKLMAEKAKLSRGKAALKFGIVAGVGLAIPGALATAAAVETYKTLLPLFQNFMMASGDVSTSAGGTAVTAGCVTLIATTKPLMSAARFIADYVVPENTPKLDTRADNATMITIVSASSLGSFTSFISALTTNDSIPDVRRLSQRASDGLNDVFNGQLAMGVATLAAGFAMMHYIEYKKSKPKRSRPAPEILQDHYKPNS